MKLTILSEVVELNSVRKFSSCRVDPAHIYTYPTYPVTTTYLPSFLLDNRLSVSSVILAFLRPNSSTSVGSSPISFTSRDISLGICDLATSISLSITQYNIIRSVICVLHNSVRITLNHRLSIQFHLSLALDFIK